MPAVQISTEDLAPFATIADDKAEAMIADALALAKQIAPCIAQDEFAYADAAKAVIRGAILRWNEAGTGALAQRTAGPYSEVLDTRQTRRAMFWPSEIEQLQSMCASSASGAFAVDTAPGATVGGAVIVHSDICALNFGADYCSCGAILTQGLGLYE